jgi:DNA-directed RNA polymerase specialized sigma24 family protein
VEERQPQLSVDDCAQVAALAELRAALDGGGAAARALVDRLTPVVQVRVARTLLRRHAAAGGRDLRQEVGDLTQEVFLSLFREGGRALRAWNPARGLSFENFVGLLSERLVSSILRTERASPFMDLPTAIDVLDKQARGAPPPDNQAASREMLQVLLAGVRARLSPRGQDLFWRLIVREEPVEVVAAATGMTADAIYAWRSRLTRTVRAVAATLVADPMSRSAAPPGTSRGQVPR